MSQQDNTVAEEIPSPPKVCRCLFFYPDTLVEAMSALCTWCCPLHFPNSVDSSFLVDSARETRRKDLD